MGGILDRLSSELDAVGRRAREVMDEGRLRVERFRLIRERDDEARRLGYLVHRRERGQVIEQSDVEARLQRIDELDAAVAKLEREMAASRGEAVSVNETPPPAGAEPGEAAEVR